MSIEVIRAWRVGSEVVRGGREGRVGRGGGVVRGFMGSMIGGVSRVISVFTVINYASSGLSGLYLGILGVTCNRERVIARLHVTATAVVEAHGGDGVRSVVRGSGVGAVHWGC